MSIINVEAADLWDYFEEHEFELKNHMHEIASSYEYGVNVFITNEDGLGEIVVYVDDEELYSESFIDRISCACLAREIYDSYLSYGYLNSECNTKIESDDDDEIGMREETLDWAVIDFLDAVFDTGVGSVSDMGIDDIVQDLKNHFLEYMYRRWGMEIYRPMYLIDENGEEFREEYPYSHIIFDK